MNFTLRPWALDDITSLVKYANNPKIARYMMDGFLHPYTPEVGRRFIEFATQDDPIHIFAIDINGQAVGGIGLHPKADIDKKNAELAYWLGEDFWGQGIVTDAVKKMLVFGFKTYDINRIYGRVFGTNIGSQKVLEKAGFTLEARFSQTFFKNGGYEDELIYAVRRQNFLLEA
jgi:RimJ/RimL family protein N-acetyltransferase